VQYFPNNVNCNTFHWSCNNTIQLLCSNIHIMFTVTHSIQPAIQLSNSCAVTSTYCALQHTPFYMKFHCPHAVQSLPNNLDCNAFNSRCKITLYLLWCTTHIMFTVTHSIQSLKKIVRLLCSPYHIMFTVKYSIQPAITLSTCYEVTST